MYNKHVSDDYSAELNAADDNTARDDYGRPFVEADVSADYKAGFYAYRAGFNASRSTGRDWLAGFNDAADRDAGELA